MIMCKLLKNLSQTSLDGGKQLFVNTFFVIEAEKMAEIFTINLPEVVGEPDILACGKLNLKSQVIQAYPPDKIFVTIIISMENALRQ